MSSKQKTTSPQEKYQITLVPKLRFPEFGDSKEWTRKQLKEIAAPISDRARQGEKNSILRLSAEHGIISQGELLENKVAAEHSERYLKVLRDDFIYSDTTTNASAHGTIKRLSKHSDGVVSPLYKCFRFHAEENPVFWEQYFESGIHQAQLSSIVNGGVRAGRTNISINQLLSINVWHTHEREQKKISECLRSAGDLIDAQTRKLNALKTHKKGLTQQLFPRKDEPLPRLRFPEFQNHGEWEEHSFGDLVKIKPGRVFKTSEYSKTGIRLMQVQNVGCGVTKWNENTVYLPETYADEYPELVLRSDDIVLALYGSNSSDELKISRIPINESISILYQRVGKIEITNTSLRVDFAFQICRETIKDFIESKSIGNGQPLAPLKELYAKKVYLPSSPEQHRIAHCLTDLDNLIILHTKKLEITKTHKEALMQQLFPSTNEVEV